MRHAWRPLFAYYSLQAVIGLKIESPPNGLVLSFCFVAEINSRVHGKLSHEETTLSLKKIGMKPVLYCPRQDNKDITIEAIRIVGVVHHLFVFCLEKFGRVRGL